MPGTVLLGPLLSFRGVDESDPARKLWRVTAMVVLRGGPPPAQAELSVTDPERGAAPATATRRSPLQLGMIDPSDEAAGRVWRFDLTVPMRADAPRRVDYLLPGLATRHGGPAGGRFEVPAIDAMPRLACASCNGFSSVQAMNAHARDEQDVWRDLRATHEAAPFHLLLMGGDQVYADTVLQQAPGSPLAPLADWAGRALPVQVATEPSAAVRAATTAYYRRFVVDSWGARTRADGGVEQREAEAAMACIPTVMMWDDHDILDGWGSHPDALQGCAVMRMLFRHAREAFWMLQLQNPLTGADGRPGSLPDADAVPDDGQPPPDWEACLRDDPLAVRPLPGQGGFSRLLSVGPLLLLVLDTRSERTLARVVRERTWQAVEHALDAARQAGTHRHLLAMVSVPVAHPDLKSLSDEVAVLDANRPLADRLGDDLEDQWCLPSRAADRLRLVKLLLRQAEGRGPDGAPRHPPLRATLLSGDVHVAARGLIERRDYAPDRRWLRILQLTSSGIVHPSSSVARLLLERMPRRTMLDADHHAEVLPLQGRSPLIVDERNWMAIEPVMGDADGGAPAWTGALRATWRCEDTRPPSSATWMVDYPLAPPVPPPRVFAVTVDPA